MRGENGGGGVGQVTMFGWWLIFMGMWFFKQVSYVR